MATKNIYAEVIDTYNGLCKKVGDILNVSWNYWDSLKTKIENIYDTIVYDRDGTVLFEKLGFKDLVDDDCYLEGNWSNMRDDFAITIISTSKNYVKVKLYDVSSGDDSTASLKIPVEYLQSDNYEVLIKAKYEAIDKEIDRRTKKKSNGKENKIKEIVQPEIEPKEKLKELIIKMCKKTANL